MDNSKLHYQLGHFHDIILYIYIDGLSYLPSIENSNITNRSRNRNSQIGGSDWSSCLQNLQLKHEFELKAVLRTSWSFNSPGWILHLYRWCLGFALKLPMDSSSRSRVLSLANFYSLHKKDTLLTVTWLVTMNTERMPNNQYQIRSVMPWCLHNYQRLGKQSKSLIFCFAVLHWDIDIHDQPYLLIPLQ